MEIPIGSRNFFETKFHTGIFDIFIVSLPEFINREKFESGSTLKLMLVKNTK
jgi:hypothetical protein